MRETTYNFSPGPAVLPLEVLERAREAIIDYNGTGIGVAELSHRGPEFEEIIGQAEARLRSLLNLSSEYAVLFTTGGATMQFSMVPMNLLGARSGNYLLSGDWAQRAAKEAKKFGRVHIAGSTEADGFRTLPQIESLSEDAAYLHFTSNNTIAGTQYQREPAAPRLGSEVPLICDASSDFLSRRIDASRYSLIYAGAQKNLGPAGVTVVILHRALLERCPDGLPLMLDYRTYAEHRSLYNTPPTFPIYLVGEVLRWLEDLGGLEAIEQRNEAKAATLYRALDESEFYRSVVDPACRSRMNVVFRLANPELEDKFIAEAAAAGLKGLRGHRSVGGMRASIYNAFPAKGVEALVAFMERFEKANS